MRVVIVILLLLLSIGLWVLSNRNILGKDTLDTVEKIGSIVAVIAAVIVIMFPTLANPSTPPNDETILPTSTVSTIAPTEAANNHIETLQSPQESDTSVPSLTPTLSTSVTEIPSTKSPTEIPEPTIPPTVPTSTTEPEEIVLPEAQFAVYSFQDEDDEIYFMSLGSGESNLTQNPGWDFHPTWSPDGEKLAFYSLREGNFEIFVMNADGSQLINLTNNSSHDEFPAWSPSGEKIAFMTDRDGRFTSSLYIMNADGSNPVKVASANEQNCIPIWIPNGEKVALVGSNCDILVANEDGSEAQILSIDSLIGIPTWSPNGSEIAFTANFDGKNDIYIAALNDLSETIRITNNSSTESSLAWSPDGKYISFTMYKNDNTDIYMVDVENRETIRITSDEGTEREHQWSPDSKYIAFLRREHLFIIDILTLLEYQVTQNSTEWRTHGSYQNIVFDWRPNQIDP